MISVNGKQIEFTSFPDKTSSFRYKADDNAYTITWKYEGDHECMLLWYLVHHIREHIENTPINLYMPYIPNARMDRVKACDEVFTLKWFSEFINSLHFDFVKVLDPHSNVSTALIDRVEVVPAAGIAQIVLDDLNSEEQLDVLLCYPDEGAAKRYSSEISGDYVFCIKHRDWRAGKIERLELTTPDKVNGRNVLIVDDICSRGGTFTHTAKALKKAGAKDIFMYVTHCEDTIVKGNVLTDGLIAHVFTTDSIPREQYDKMTVIHV